ncbi:MAG TPA: CHRD domain-containing protein [Thermomicrobiales bacterium]|nr:CHRD domain-containing protein [Thermomicrobiales bacterium]
MRTLRLLVALLASMLVAIGLIGSAGAAPAAAGGKYTASLSGAEEVPARDTPGTGSATFQVSADGMSITYTLSVQNIKNVTMAHIHVGKKGENGAVVVPLIAQRPPGGGPTSGMIGQGTFTAKDLVGPMQGKTIADLVAAMDSGGAYANVHTDDGVAPTNTGAGDFPGGEIRGQIMMAGAPGLPNTGGGGMARGASALPWLMLAVVLTVGMAGASLAFGRRRA